MPAWCFFVSWRSLTLSSGGCLQDCFPAGYWFFHILVGANVKTATAVSGLVTSTVTVVSIALTQPQWCRHPMARHCHIHILRSPGTPTQHTSSYKYVDRGRRWRSRFGGRPLILWATFLTVAVQPFSYAIFPGRSGCCFCSPLKEKTHIMCSDARLSPPQCTVHHSPLVDQVHARAGVECVECSGRRGDLRGGRSDADGLHPGAAADGWLFCCTSLQLC